MRAMRITPFLFPLLLSSAAIAQPAGDDPWKFGALRFGMSTQEARAQNLQRPLPVL